MVILYMDNGLINNQTAKACRLIDGCSFFWVSKKKNA